MTTSETANTSNSVVAGTCLPARMSTTRAVLTGLTVAMLVAAVLVLRGYLPRVLFGDLGTLNAKWPAFVFFGYTLLGGAVLFCIARIDRLLHTSHAMSMPRRMLIGSVLVIASTGAVAYGIIKPLSWYLVEGEPALAAMWMISSVLGTVGYAIFLMHRASIEHREHVLRLQLEADELDTTLARAELSMLEAQIEPHFLFNTLAHIKRQYRIDPNAADQMLATLIDYLNRALPALRRDDWTVGDELDLVQVYLGILEQRFGNRLRFTITASENCRAMRLPALTVATLVENAIRHGLTPKPEGGVVSIAAVMDGATLCIAVCDNGVGLRHTSGTGLGLATVRARLRTAFGDKASLLVEPNGDTGLRASIRIPGVI